MNIFITGVAGFIGANITKRILEDNPTDTIIGIDNLNEYYDIKIKIWRLKQFEKNRRFVFIKGSIADKAVITRIFKTYHPSVVVNLAAQAGVRYSITNYNGIVI